MCFFEKAANVVIESAALFYLHPFSNTSLISSRASEDLDALTVFYRSAGLNNMSEDQFGGHEQEMGEGVCSGGSRNNSRRTLCGRK